MVKMGKVHIPNGVFGLKGYLSTGKQQKGRLNMFKHYVGFAPDFYDVLSENIGDMGCNLPKSKFPSLLAIFALVEPIMIFAT